MALIEYNYPRSFVNRHGPNSIGRRDNSGYLCQLGRSAFARHDHAVRQLCIPQRLACLIAELTPVDDKPASVTLFNSALHNPDRHSSLTGSGWRN
jgi:hypothetical protein